MFQIALPGHAVLEYSLIPQLSPAVPSLKYAQSTFFPRPTRSKFPQNTSRFTSSGHIARTLQRLQTLACHTYDMVYGYHHHDLPPPSSGVSLSRSSGTFLLDSTASPILMNQDSPLSHVPLWDVPFSLISISGSVLAFLIRLPERESFGNRLRPMPSPIICRPLCPLLSPADFRRFLLVR